MLARPGADIADMYAIEHEMAIGPASRLIVLPSRLEHAMSGSNNETHMYVSLCIDRS